MLFRAARVLTSSIKTSSRRLSCRFFSKVDHAPSITRAKELERQGSIRKAGEMYKQLLRHDPANAAAMQGLWHLWGKYRSFNVPGQELEWFADLAEEYKDVSDVHTP